MTANTEHGQIRVLSLGSGIVKKNKEVEYTPKTYSHMVTSRVSKVLLHGRLTSSKNLSVMKERSSSLETESSSTSSDSLKESSVVDRKSLPADVNAKGLPVFDIDSCSDCDLLGGESHLANFSRREEIQGVREMLSDLTPKEKAELTDPAMLIRHFRAEKGDVARALESLRSALQWRRDFDVSRLRTCMQEPQEKELQEMMFREDQSGKLYNRGVNKQGRALVYMKAMNNKTPNAEEDNMKHLIWNIEKAVSVTRHFSGGELDKFCLMIDCNNFRLSKAPSLSVAKFTLDVLQKHYPERMYRAFVLNPPMTFRVFWNLVKPFVDPVTKTKVVFVTPGTSGVDTLYDVMGEEQMKKLEPHAFGKYPVREFNSKEHLTQPFHIPFDI
eukprot:Nitzschia sp. Nitz4//scaffold230_size58257//22057//23211//NITZ4_006479-RA/size58257-processed-gene-0.63-mRNA-1//-1//CDS//3329543244//6597//frame0